MFKEAADRDRQEMQETAGCSARLTISKEDLQTLNAGGVETCIVYVVQENSLGLKGRFDCHVDRELLGPGTLFIYYS